MLRPTVKVKKISWALPCSSLMNISDGWVLHRPTSSFTSTKSLTRSLESTKMWRQFLNTWQVLVTPIVFQESWSSRLDVWNFLVWLGFLCLATTFWPRWDFLAWLELLGLARTSLPGLDFLTWLVLLGLSGTSWLFETSWPGWDFLAWLGLLGNWWNKLRLCCLYT